MFNNIIERYKVKYGKYAGLVVAGDEAVVNHYFSWDEEFNLRFKVEYDSKEEQSLPKNVFVMPLYFNKEDMIESEGLIERTDKGRYFPDTRIIFKKALTKSAVVYIPQPVNKIKEVVSIADLKDIKERYTAFYMVFKNNSAWKSFLLWALTNMCSTKYGIYIRRVHEIYWLSLLYTMKSIKKTERLLYEKGKYLNVIGQKKAGKFLDEIRMLLKRKGLGRKIRLKRILKYRNKGEMPDKIKYELFEQGVVALKNLSKEFSEKSRFSEFKLMKAGMPGLFKAIEHRSLGSELNFQKYSVWWMRQHILREINDFGKVIKIPDNYRRHKILSSIINMLFRFMQYDNNRLK